MQRIQESEQRPLLAFCGRTQKYPDLQIWATSTLTRTKVNQGKRRVRPPHLVGRSITSGEISLVGSESCQHFRLFGLGDLEGPSEADFVAACRLASVSSMGLFAPVGEVDKKSASGPVRASRTDRRSDRSCP